MPECGRMSRGNSKKYCWRDDFDMFLADWSNLASDHTVWKEMDLFLGVRYYSIGLKKLKKCF